MLRTLHVEVEVEDAFSNEVERMDLPSQEKGVMKKVVWNEWFARGYFDRAGTRIEISLTRIFDYHESGLKYMLSVSNFNYSHEFSESELRRVSYRMWDKTLISKVDCDSVQMACWLLKSLIDSYLKTNETDVRQNLVMANRHLEKTEKLIESEGGEVGQYVAETFKHTMERTNKIYDLLNNR